MADAEDAWKALSLEERLTSNVCYILAKNPEEKTRTNTHFSFGKQEKTHIQR